MKLSLIHFGSICYSIYVKSLPSTLNQSKFFLKLLFFVLIILFLIILLRLNTIFKNGHVFLNIKLRINKSIYFEIFDPDESCI